MEKMENEAEGDTVMTRHDIADMLKISPRSVENRLRDGTLPEPFRVGRMRRWWKRDVLEALK